MGYHSLGPIYFGFWKPDLFLSTSLSHMNVHVFVGGGDDHPEMCVFSTM